MGSHTREFIIRLDKNLYGLKDAGLVWFEKLKEGLEVIRFLQLQVDPFVWYRELTILLFYVGGFLIFSPSKDKIDNVYASLQEYFNK